jgi:hypothetical protein
MQGQLSILGNTCETTDVGMGLAPRAKCVLNAAWLIHHVSTDTSEKEATALTLSMFTTQVDSTSPAPTLGQQLHGCLHRCCAEVLAKL